MPPVIGYISGVGAPNVTFTIGYAGKSVDVFVQKLRAAGVKQVVDIRALPLSRKKGFSKTSLGSTLADADIEYLHLRVAGNPFRAQRANVAACLALYSKYVDDHPEVVDAVETAVHGGRVALLCFEAEACDCHRSVIVERLALRNPRQRVRHL